MSSAFFYQRATALDRNLHRKLRIKPLSDAAFAEKSHAVPLVGIEFPDACMEYPIVFSRGRDDSWMALAVTGLAEDENLFIDPQHRWAGRYVPACIRRYPFILVDNGEQPYGVAIDLGSANIGEDLEGGEPLFDAQGEPAPLLQSMMSWLGDFQAQIGATQALIRRMAEADLLVQSDVDIRLEDGRSAKLVGPWIVDEARFRKVADADVLNWFRTGELALIHAHLLSLRNLLPLLQRRAAPTAAAQA